MIGHYICGSQYKQVLQINLKSLRANELKNKYKNLIKHNNDIYEYSQIITLQTFKCIKKALQIKD